MSAEFVIIMDNFPCARFQLTHHGWRAEPLLFIHEGIEASFTFVNFITQWKFWEVKCLHRDNYFSHHETSRSSRTHCSSCFIRIY